MLKRITIRDFQSHKETVLDLHAGVNVIVGNSDSGKSAILRALTWAINNTAEDKNFQRYGSKETSVKLDFDDCSIERLRNKDNIYNLTVGKKKQEFKAFKTAIPEDVANMLNLSDINIQTQLEAPFLLSQTSGEVSKTLNRMVDLSVIHESINSIKKEVNDNNSDIREVTKQIEENAVLLGEFKFLKQLEKKVKAYELLCSEQETVTANIQALSKLERKAQELRVVVNSFEHIDELAEKVEQAQKSVDEIRAVSKQIKQIASLVDSICSNQEQYEGLKKLIVLEPKVNEAIDLVKIIAKLEDSIRIHDRYQSVNEKLEVSIADKETEYVEIMPETCPLCGNVVIEEIV